MREAFACPIFLKPDDFELRNTYTGIWRIIAPFFPILTLIASRVAIILYHDQLILSKTTIPLSMLIAVPLFLSVLSTPYLIRQGGGASAAAMRILIFTLLIYATITHNGSGDRGDQPIPLRGVLAECTLGDSPAHILIHTDTGKSLLVYSYITKEKFSHFAPGRRITTDKELVPALHDTSLPEGYRAYLVRHGIDATCFLDQYTLADHISGEAKIDRITGARNHLTGTILRTYEHGTAGILTALVTGTRHYISPLEYETMQRGGILHLLAASGMHLALLLMLPLFITRKTGIHPLLGDSIALSLAFLYLLLAGSPVSLYRAVLFFGISRAAFHLRLPLSQLQVLLLSALVLLMVRPEELFQLGFHLSFFATMGILFWYKSLHRGYTFLPGYVAKSLALSMAAQMLIYPVLLHATATINLTAAITTLLISPLLPLIMVAGMTGIIALPGPLENLTLFLTNGTGGLIQLVTDMAASWNLHFFSVEPTPILLLLWIALILVTMIARHLGRWTLPLHLLLMVALTFSLLHHRKETRIESVKKLNEGATSAVLHNNTLLLAGAMPDETDLHGLVSDARATGATERILLLSDTDDTTLWNCRRLMRKLPVKRCYIPDGYNFSFAFQSLIQTASDSGTTVVFYPADKTPDPFKDAGKAPIDTLSVEKRLR